MGYWKELRDRTCNDDTRMEVFADIIERSLGERIVYEGFSLFNIELIQKYKLRLGKFAYFWREDKKEYVVARCSFIGGERYADGVLNKLLCTCVDGKIFEFDDWRNNDKVVVGFSNKLHSPNFNIPWFANQLAEVDKSQKALVLFARAHGFIVAENETQADEIRRGIKDVSDGKVYTIRKDPLSNNNVELVNLGQVEASRWLQDLSVYQNTLCRRLYFLEGCDIGSSIKKAQQTEEETTRSDNASKILAYEDLHYSNLFCEEVSKKFHPASCRLSDLCAVRDKIKPDEIVAVRDKDGEQGLEQSTPEEVRN